jgi:hypothetical protein
VRLLQASYVGRIRESQREGSERGHFSKVCSFAYVTSHYFTGFIRTIHRHLKYKTTLTPASRRLYTLDDTSVSSDLTASNFGSTSSSFLLALASEPGSLSSINRLGGMMDQRPTARMTGRYSKHANIGSFVAGPLR